MPRLAAFAGVWMMAGCLERGTTVCADGRLCPAGAVCDPVHGGCLEPSQLTSCTGRGDGEPCELEGRPIGTCRDQICVRAACGDQRAEGLEACDGPDLRGRVDCGDLGYHDPGPIACRADCTWDVDACARICGDGIADPEEACDAASGLVVADCLAVGFYEPGAVTCTAGCGHDTHTCRGTCGDGVINGPELCDGARPVEVCTDFGFDRGRLDCSRCGLAFAECARIGWITNYPDVARVEAISGTGSDDVWVVGTDVAGGRLSHFDGAGWTTRELGVVAVHDVVAFAGAVFVAVGDDGVLVERGGTLVPSTGFVATTLWGTGPDDVYAGGSGGVLHFDGVTWTPLPSQPTGVLVRDLGGRGATLWAVTNWGLQRFDGNLWSTVAVPGGIEVARVWAAPDADLLVAATNAGPYVWAGAWTPSPFIGLFSYDVGGSASDRAFAIGDGGRIFRWDGEGWTLFQNRPAGGSPSVDRLWAGDRVLYEGGAGWLGYATTEWEGWDAAGGSALWVGADDVLCAGSQVNRHAGGWPMLHTPAGSTAIWALDRDQAWTLDAGTLYTHTGTVTTSEPLPEGAGESVWATAVDDVWVAGVTAAAAPAVWHRDAGGWSSAFVGTAAAGSLRDVHGAGGAIWAVGDHGLVVRRAGGIWQALPPPADRTLHAVWSLGVDEAIAVGEGGLIVRWIGGSWRTEVSHTSAPLFDLWAVDAGDVFAVGAGGAVRHFDGVTWSPIAAPTGVDLIAVAGRADLVVFVDADAYSLALHRMEPW